MTGLPSLWRGAVTRPPTMAGIAAEVAVQHRVTVADIRGPSRVRGLVRARQEFMARAWVAGKTKCAIGRYLGRDHTTVIYGLRVHLTRRTD